MKALLRSHEMGSVMLLTGVAMFPIMFLMAFAIDVSHWFDYSRNLQNRADAAALAAGSAFGSMCLQAGATPGTTANGAQSAIGKWAQLYSGAGRNEPVGRLPYTDAAVSAATNAAAGTGTGPGTGWNVATNGYINNTKGGTVVNKLALKLGSLSDYWLVLNGKDYAENGGTSFSMMPTGAGPATFCKSDPKEDLSDPNRASAGAAGPMVDVKVSQRNLPLFFPLIGIRPNIHAHARIQLQGEASSPHVRPIAVSDPGQTPCLSVDFINATTNAVIYTAVLKQKTQINPTDPIIWDNATPQAGIPGTGPANFASWPTDNVYLQPYLNNCNGSGNRYDVDTHTGLLYLNSHPASDPTVGTGNPPALAAGGVFLTTGNCAPDQYFSVGDCKDSVTAYVKFNPAIPKNDTIVTVVDRAWDPSANGGNGAYVSSAPLGMSRDNTDHTLWTSANGAGNQLSVPDQSGIHEVEIHWEQQSGSITGKGACTNQTATNPCKGSFGQQAQAFGACNGCDQPDDSGPMILTELRQASQPGTFGASSFARGSVQSLVVTLKLAGISAAPAGSKPQVLRFPTSGNHQTGLIDCGQGNGQDAAIVFYGCGPSNPVVPGLNPLFVNTRNTCGTPPGPPWPNGTDQDCVQTTPGTRRNNIICPLVDRITGAPFGTVCNGGSPGVCPVDGWLSGNPLGTDARAITFILTTPIDLGAANGAPQFWIPIRRFATFYITGWDSQIKPQCGTTGPNANEAFPGSKKTNADNAAVWGHWINFVDPGGTSDGNLCDTSSGEPTNCVPALTR